MKELSLNILDIAENSVKAGATLTEITLTETLRTLTLSIKDNGSGMSEEVLRSVTNPFYTTRTTRSVGLGIPLLKLASEQTGGKLTITSKLNDGKTADHGTVVSALFYKEHIDFTPLGDVTSTLITLIQGHPERDFLFTHEMDGIKISLDTREIRTVLEDVPLSTPEVLEWIKGNLISQYEDAEF